LSVTWWGLFQKRVVRTKFDIYVFIIVFTMVRPYHQIIANMYRVLFFFCWYVNVFMIIPCCYNAVFFCYDSPY
jgi:hypothetical protein